MSSNDALDKAQDAGLDLVEVSPNAEPPVCRIMDFGKYKFENSKKKQAAKKKQKKIQVKEIKFRPRTEEGDYQVKLKKLITFLACCRRLQESPRIPRGRDVRHRRR